MSFLPSLKSAECMRSGSRDTGTTAKADRSIGLRHVQEEEDQVRWEAAGLYALHQLQDGVYLHTS